MPRRFDDEDEEDREAPLPGDQAIGDEDDEDLDPMSCPYCGKAMSERQDVCPHCHSFVLHEDGPRRRPTWVRATVIIVILALLLAIGKLW